MPESVRLNDSGPTNT